MFANSLPYDITCFWDSVYLCKRCGNLLYYDMDTKQDFCLNTQCQDYPSSVDIFATGMEDLKQFNAELADKEAELGQIIRTCDYNVLVVFLLEYRRRIVERFFSIGKMKFEEFLLSNDLLLFSQKYKSLGIRKDRETFHTILQLFTVYAGISKMIEDIKEGRYLLARIPFNKIFRMKYFDVIINEIWASYGLVNIESNLDINTFKYHEVIQNIVGSKSTLISADYAQYFDKLWPFAISTQYLFKRNYQSSLKYQYSVTSTDLANILSIIFSLKNNKLTSVSLINWFNHFVLQPIRDKNVTEFINMLSGDGNNVPIVMKIGTHILLDRPTMLLFFVLMYSQHLPSAIDVSGQQRITQSKQKIGHDFEESIKDKLTNKGYTCLSASSKIAGKDYDIVAILEAKQEILLIETKFKDPSPSSLTKDTLITQEFLEEKYGLLPEVIKHQRRYDLLKQKGKLFEAKLKLTKNIDDYSVTAYFVTKYTPLINRYGDIQVLSEKEFLSKSLT